MVGDYIIIAPCYNEEKVIAKFLAELEQKLLPIGASFSVVIVDDASSDSTAAMLNNFSFESQNFDLHYIKLVYNMGHQEAIRQGLQYANTIVDTNVKGVIVMDSDGEDDPSAILELIKKDSFEIVYVSRGKRFESVKFKTGYFFYKLLFKFTTGKKINFGNYCIMAPNVLAAIQSQSFFHFAGFLSKQRFTIDTEPFDRQKRIDGKSKMNYKGLVFHGLASIIEYAEEILFSLLKLFLLLFVALVGLGGYVLYTKFISKVAIAGWASSIGANMAIAMLIIISTLIIGLLLLSIKKTILQKNGCYKKIR